MYGVILYDEHQNKLDYWSFKNSSRVVSVASGTKYIVVYNVNNDGDPATRGIVKNTDTDEVLFEWRK